MKLNLNIRIIGFITLVIVSMGVLSSAFFFYTYKKGIEREMTARATSMAESLAMSIDEGLASENLDLLKHIQKISNSKDVALCQVFSTLWLPIDAYPADSFNLSPYSAAVTHFEESQVPFHHVEKEYYESYCPVYYSQFSRADQSRKYIIGYVRIQISPEYAQTSIRKAIGIYASLFAACTAALILMLSLFIKKQILTPLLTLHQAVSKSTHHDLPLPVPVSGNNEIGELSRAFNLMCDNLLKRDTLLHEQTVVLEQEIAERQVAQEELAVKQHQLQVLNDSLGERVKGAIQELREKDRIMMQQSRLATMGEMIGNIAHQWRQPLNNIGLYVQGIGVEIESGDPDPEHIGHSIANCMESLKYLSKTIDDFRNFFQPEKETKRFPLIQPVENAIKLLKPSFDHSRICLKMKTSGEDVWVNGYPNELAQAIVNLLLNSKDAHLQRKTAEPWVSLSTGFSVTEGWIKVEDNAGGIPPDIAEKIFDPYFTTKHQSQGTGLGLYIAKTIIEKNMGGSLSAAETPAGSVFTITLPLENPV